MRWSKPRQLSTGLWHYTTEIAGTVLAVGGCEPGQGCTGHATADEARECYRQWALRNTEINSSDGHESVLYRCHMDGCSRWAAGNALVPHPGLGTKILYLCRVHLNMETLRRVLPPPGDVYSS